MWLMLKAILACKQLSERSAVRFPLGYECYHGKGKSAPGTFTLILSFGNGRPSDLRLKSFPS
jgi:hypothetical protein